MKTKIIFILAALVTVATSCLKEPAAPTGGNKILIGATTTDTTSYLFAKVSTQINSTGGNQISQHGHCWSIAANPDTNNFHTTLGNIVNPGKFTSELWGLSDHVKYFIRSYFTFQGNTVYGAQTEIMTLKRGKPVVITDSAFEITISSAKISGNATFDSGLAITQKGICWDTAAYPTLMKSIGHSEEGAGSGSFVSSITQLMNNRQYYFCAYAVNERGTSYGEIKSFSTVPINLPMVITLDVTNVTLSSATCGGFVSGEGNGTVSARGVCWNTTGNPTLTNCLNKTQDGTGLGNFNSGIYGLQQGTTYFVAAYAKNEKGTAYGEVKQFTSIPITKPTVIISNITDVTRTSAVCGGNVTSAGNGNVTKRGVCWSTNLNPTTANSHTSDGTGIGVFVSYLTNLIPNTLYYVRAYATNESGTAYDNHLSFTTLSNQAPTVTTTPVTNITNTTVMGGGNVTNDGGINVTARGVCYSVSPNPTLANSYTINGAGIGVFESNVSGLSPYTIYYVRAYAINSMGTSYGNELNFTTAFLCGLSITINHVAGTIAPVDKTVTYNTVNNIPGETSKCWISSNLGADHQASSVNDATEHSSGWYWQFNRKQGFKHDGSNRTPNSIWLDLNENSNWSETNDPCFLELGNSWRIPTSTEWNNVDQNGNWTNWDKPWDSDLNNPPSKKVDLKSPYKGPNSRLCCSSMRSCFS